MIRHTHWHWLGVPRGMPHSSSSYKLNIVETVQNPTLNQIYCCSHWLWAPPTVCVYVLGRYPLSPPVHIRLIITETIQNPTLNLYVVVHYKMHSVALTLDPQGVCPNPSSLHAKYLRNYLYIVIEMAFVCPSVHPSVTLSSPLHISWTCLKIFIKLWLNVRLSESMCRTRKSTMPTQGQGHRSRSWVWVLNFVSAPYLLYPWKDFL